jgi:hypothetical protein
LTRPWSLHCHFNEGEGDKVSADCGFVLFSKIPPENDHFGLDLQFHTYKITHLFAYNTETLGKICKMCFVTPGDKHVAIGCVRGVSNATNKNLDFLSYCSIYVRTVYYNFFITINRYLYTFPWVDIKNASGDKNCIRKLTHSTISFFTVFFLRSRRYQQQRFLLSVNWLKNCFSESRSTVELTSHHARIINYRFAVRWTHKI